MRLSSQVIEMSTNYPPTSPLCVINQNEYWVLRFVAKYGYFERSLRHKNRINSLIEKGLLVRNPVQYYGSGHNVQGFRLTHAGGRLVRSREQVVSAWMFSFAAPEVCVVPAIEP